jgi:hypothetical protein
MQLIFPRVMAHVCNSSTQEVETEDRKLGYIASCRQVEVTWQDLILKREKKRNGTDIYVDFVFVT